MKNMTSIQIVKKLFQIAVISFVLMYSAYSVVFFVFHSTMEKVCGTVVSKPNDEISIKYGTKTAFYLSVQTASRGFQTIEVDATTYFGTNKNDLVCFNLRTNMSMFEDVSFFIGMVLSVMLPLIIAVVFMLWIFNVI